MIQIRGLQFTKLKGGEGSGFHGHAGRPGSVGGSAPNGKGFVGEASFETQVSFGTAHADGSITFNKEQYTKLDKAGRETGIAHEIIHNTVEDYVLHNNNEWDMAETALLIQEGGKGRKLFFGGNARIGESISDAMGSYLSGEQRPEGLSTEKWNSIMTWAEGAIRRSGYNPTTLQKDIMRIGELLDAQL